MSDQQTPPAAPEAGGTSPGKGDIPVFKNEPIMVLILGIVTCGLYLIYWNMKMAEVLNAATGREVISPTIAAISGCCAPLNVYFYYQAGQALGDIGRLTGNPRLQDKSTLLTILGLLLPIVAALILQGEVNGLYESE